MTKLAQLKHPDPMHLKAAAGWIQLGDYDPDARRDMVRLRLRVREAVGRLYKVVPTALVAAAIRPLITRTELEDRIDQMIEIFRSVQANLDVTTGRAAVDAATDLLATSRSTGTIRPSGVSVAIPRFTLRNWRT